jgi:hypothetical protein
VDRREADGKNELPLGLRLIRYRTPFSFSEALPAILPPMTVDEAIETTKIRSVVGLLSDKSSLIATHPFCSPHHTISDAGLIGGGTMPLFDVN